VGCVSLVVAHDVQTLPRPSEFWKNWALDPEVVYLNHGSFGACPRAVLDVQTRLRERMEREAVRFFVQDMDGLIDESRAALAAFVKCRGEDLVFVPNATTGVATVLMNLQGMLNEGDEILMTGHEYPACMNSMRRTSMRTGAKVVTAPIPFPLKGPDDVMSAVMDAVTPRTRVALISHVTSPSGVILPVDRIVPELERRGVITIVDGAHAPGQVAGLDLTALGASFYTANCHKWVCSPKGSALLHIREDRQKIPGGFRPLALSNFAEKSKANRKHLLTEFDYVGTGDLTPYMSIAAALRTMSAMVPGGWPEVMRRNNELVVGARRTLCRELGIEPPAPESMIGSLSTLFLPPHDGARTARLLARPSKYHDALQDVLVEKHRIQVPLWSIAGDGRRLFRISAQLYNSMEQYVYLAAALKEELAAESRL
jgi:isopenicillin-N epimerase